NGNGVRMERMARLTDAPLTELAAAAEASGEALTHHSVAEEFVNQCSGRLRYDCTENAWYEFIGTHWRKDEKRLVFEAIRQMCVALSAGSKGKALKEARAAG